MRRLRGLMKRGSSRKGRVGRVWFKPYRKPSIKHSAEPSSIIRESRSVPRDEVRQSVSRK